jgi:hypothetical protein
VSFQARSSLRRDIKIRDVGSLDLKAMNSGRGHPSFTHLFLSSESETANVRLISQHQVVLSFEAQE